MDLKSACAEFRAVDAENTAKINDPTVSLSVRGIWRSQWETLDTVRRRVLCDEVEREARQPDYDDGMGPGGVAC